ncbi:MAG: Gfo/Idh/MocA family oxidoreductase [Pirellulales bacterium]|nr:Gfo/Idh/MocA family oxidoreductase [Pirellulales bacterium]
MYLTPEDRAIGKENFYAAIGSVPIRRELLMRSIKEQVKSGKGLGALYFKYGDSVPEPVRVAVLGTGDEGSVLIGALNPKYMLVKAIADIRPYSRWRAFHGDVDAPKARPGLMKIYDWKTEEEAKKNVAVYEAYEKLIEEEVKKPEKERIEAVIIALPLHLHSPAAIAAMKAGFHVITEKLMAHSVRECKEMARVAKKTEKLLAVGHQRHYNILYDNALELIRKRLLGDLHYIRAQWHRGNLPGKDTWQPPMPKEAKPLDAQADYFQKKLDGFRKEIEDLKKKEAESPSDKEKKELQAKCKAIEAKIPQLEEQMKDLVDAQKFGYEALQFKDAEGKVLYDRPAIEELIRWRLWDRTGGGLMAELGSHQLDAAGLYISAAHGNPKKHPHPLTVSASSSRVLYDKEHNYPDRDVEDHVFCVFEYPAPGYDPKDSEKAKKKIGVQYASINGNGFGGYGETVFGTLGTLLVESESDAMLFKGADTDKKLKVAQPKQEKNGPEKPPVLQEIKPDKDEPDEESIGIGMLGALPAERGYVEELEHFAWCIRNPSPENIPRCHPEVALGDAVIALTTNMAARKGERIEFKEEWFQIDSDETPEGEKPDVSRYEK